MANQKENLLNDKRLFKMICNNSEPIVKSNLMQIKYLHSASKFFSSHMQGLVWVSVGDITALVAFASNNHSLGIGLGCAALSTSLLASTMSTLKVDKILDKIVNKKMFAKLDKIKENPQVELFLSYLKHREDENDLNKGLTSLLQMANNPLETYSKLTCELYILSGINQNNLTNSGKTWLKERYSDSLYQYRENLNEMTNIESAKLKLLVKAYNKSHSQGVSFEGVENGKILCRDICGAFNYDELCKQLADVRGGKFQNYIQPTTNLSNSQSMTPHKKPNYSFGVNKNGQSYIDIDIDQNTINKIFGQKGKFNKSSDEEAQS